MRLVPPEFPEGEDWISVPVHTSMNLDVCTWKHRSGAEFVERTWHGWMKAPNVWYGIVAPFFTTTAPQGCVSVERHYDFTWFEYQFPEDKFDEACAFALIAYKAFSKMPESTKPPPHEWSAFEYNKDGKGGLFRR